jgi:putative transposase
MPHHDYRIEVYHPATGHYLGPADLADQATEEQITAVQRARAARTRRLKKDLQASQRERYAAATRAEAPQRLGALTTAQAGAELAQATDSDLSDLALPDLIPPAAPPTGWRTPASLAALTGPAQPHATLPRQSIAPCVPGRQADGQADPAITDEDGDAS